MGQRMLLNSPLQRECVHPDRTIIRPSKEHTVIRGQGQSGQRVVPSVEFLDHCQ